MDVESGSKAQRLEEREDVGRRLDLGSRLGKVTAFSIRNLLEHKRT